MSGLASSLGPEWFSEDPSGKVVAGQSFSLKSKRVLYHQRSKYQDILVFESETYGNVLALDDVIQCTERDEFAYQEMMAHLPLNSHPCPKSVLVVGGGDGGILRELAKHPIVEEVHLCEIDEDVISVSKKFLKKMATGFDSPKVKVLVNDGVEFVRGTKNKYDVIITDSSDPVGPAEVLYQQNYFRLIFEALKPGGIMCLQGQCLWLQEDMAIAVNVLETCKEIFEVVDYANMSVPTYSTGTIGMILAGKNKETNFRSPVTTFSEEEADKFELKYYDSEVHRAAFVLPRFMRKELKLK